MTTTKTPNPATVPLLPLAADEQQTTHLCCTVQNRLGALDRVLGALTHRGILPERFAATTLATHEDNKEQHRLQVVVSFSAMPTVNLDKLVRFLQKQVYIIDTYVVSELSRLQETTVKSSDTLTNSLTSTLASVLPISVNHHATNPSQQRRITHANNA
jgi:hypothetical protein